ncbi:hypothetical protein B4939_19115 [Vibrio cholerae]|nr:hypothetical protein [Vibrio cholerae]MCD1200665.1 hypothetical protein [Vibrio cholerae]MCD1209441.1 hypothetical protein [Vibrio cholerae]MCD1227567.1 hypothetical protein [Vibrio cholerae]MCD1231422.1 hypothetical protein [Vibrio cholerae]
MSIILQISVHFQAGQGLIGKLRHNKRLKRDCQRVAFPVPMSRGGCSCCVWVLWYALPAP